MPRRPRTLWRSIALGAATGMRTALPITTLLRRADRATLPRPLRARIFRTSAPWAVVGELAFDKAPFTPSRTDPAPWAGRIAIGGLVGGLTARAFGRSRFPLLSIVAGAAAAGVSTKLAHDARARAAASTNPIAIALAEDALAATLALGATRGLKRVPAS